MVFVSGFGGGEAKLQKAGGKTVNDNVMKKEKNKNVTQVCSEHVYIRGTQPLQSKFEKENKGKLPQPRFTPRSNSSI